VALGVLWGDRVAYLYWATPFTPLGEAIGNTALFPADQSSIGRILGAATNLLHEGQSVTEDSKYAIVKTNEGECSIAASVGEPPIAGVALAGTRSSAVLESHAETLIKTADRITSIYKESKL
jgi:hypothetical protein